MTGWQAGKNPRGFPACVRLLEGKGIVKSMTDEKKVLGVYGAGSTHWVGDGFHVRNLFPSNGLTEQVDPFLMLDYAGPTKVEPTDKARGVGEHPHRGFETVTILYQGMLQHRDSAGNSGTIGPGDVQWMTAGAGVVHEEKYDTEFSKMGGTLEMVQLWVNLPKAFKMSEPRYQTLLKEQIPVTTLGPAGYMRVIAGEMSGVDGPAKTFSRLSVCDLRLNAGHDTELCLCSGHTGVLVLLKGSLKVNGETDLSGEAVMALLDINGVMVTLQANEDSTILILSGEPLHEPLESHGPFVMNTREEIIQAVNDYHGGKMGRLP